MEVIKFFPLISNKLPTPFLAETVMKPFLFMEPNDPGVVTLLRLIRLPWIFRKVYTWYLRYFRRDEITAGLVEVISKKTTTEHYALVAQREAYRFRFFEAWQESEIDFLLTVPNPLPAVPLDGMSDSMMTLGYTFLFNIVRVYNILYSFGLANKFPTSWITLPVSFPLPKSLKILTILLPSSNELSQPFR